MDIIDKGVVEELIELGDDGDPELLLDLIEIFLSDGPAKVQLVLEGIAEGDFDKTERAAHSLKGSSGNLGATALQHVCERLQVASRKHELDAARGLSPDLENAYAAAETALRQIQTSYS